MGALVLGLPIMVYGALMSIVLAFGFAMFGLIASILQALGAPAGAPGEGSVVFSLLVATSLGQLGCGACLFIAGIGLMARQSWARFLMIGVLGLEIVLAFAWLGLEWLSAMAALAGAPSATAPDSFPVSLGQLLWSGSFVLLCAALIAGFLSDRVRREFGST